MPDHTSAHAGRAEILAAATDLFGEAGFDAVSISAIAGQAGTSKANVFHHFGSKEGLFLEVMRTACDVFSSALEEAISAEGGFSERVRAYIRSDIELMRDNPDRSHLIMREVLESGPASGRALAGEVFHDHFVELKALIEAGQSAGEFRRDVPAELAVIMMVAGNVFLFQSQNVLRHLPGVDFVDEPDRYAALASRILLDGLRHRPSETASQGNHV
jgi:TetR/AcrR family transcriptional regulator